VKPFANKGLLPSLSGALRYYGFIRPNHAVWLLSDFPLMAFVLFALCYLPGWFSFSSIAPE
jgi:hypothetical protein